MERCWCYHASDRPSFEDILSTLISGVPEMNEDMSRQGIAPLMSNGDPSSVGDSSFVGSHEEADRNVNCAPEPPQSPRSQTNYNPIYSDRNVNPAPELPEPPQPPRSQTNYNPIYSFDHSTIHDRRRFSERPPVSERQETSV